MLESQLEVEDGEYKAPAKFFQGIQDSSPRIVKDNDGSISAIDIIKWLQKMGVEREFDVVTAIMQHFDLDGNGKITSEEIMKKNQELDLVGGMMCLPYPLNSNKASFFEFITDIAFKSPEQKRSRNIIAFIGIRDIAWIF